MEIHPIIPLDNFPETFQKSFEYPQASFRQTANQHVIPLLLIGQIFGEAVLSLRKRIPPNGYWQPSPFPLSIIDCLIRFTDSLLAWFFDFLSRRT